MRGHRILGAVIAISVVCPSAAHAMVSQAAEAKYTYSFTKAYTPSAWTQEMGYKKQAGGKFLFGGKNALLGWMELYNEPRHAARAKQNIAKGFGRGLLNTLGDTIGGVVHLATFPIRAVDVTLPEGGTDIL